jgi:hypothetical protein
MGYLQGRNQHPAGSATGPVEAGLLQPSLDAKQDYIAGTERTSSYRRGPMG